jgi:hypothetical protein
MANGRCRRKHHVQVARYGMSTTNRWHAQQSPSGTFVSPCSTPHRDFAPNIAHASCHHFRYFGRDRACIFPPRRQAHRSACAAQRHLLWGTGRYRAALELLANSLADALHMFPRRSLDWMRKLGLVKDGEDACLLVIASEDVESEINACQR